MQRYIDGKISDKLTEIDPRQQVLRDHPVNFLPHCAVCGEHRGDDAVSTKALKISPGSIHFSADGGDRTCTPEETLKRLQRYISPLTGIVSGLTSLDNTANHIIPIYRSTFFKTPFNLKHFGNDAFTQVSLGKRISHAQSKASALGESLERYAA